MNPGEFATWRDVFSFLIVLVIGVLGVPITQYLKNRFQIEDKAAIILTGLVAAVLATLELYLSGQVDFASITMSNFPAVFGTIFTVSTLYYHLLKDSPGFWGQRFMVRKPVDQSLFT